jgi:hypothetical protein
MQRLAAALAAHNLARRPPWFHREVWERAQVIASSTPSPRGQALVNVSLVFSPYERIAYILWHVAIHCDVRHTKSGEVAGTVAVQQLLIFESPAAHSRDPAVQLVPGDAHVIKLPPTIRSPAELIAFHTRGSRSWTVWCYFPVVNDCRHHTLTVLDFLFPGQH